LAQVTTQACQAAFARECCFNDQTKVLTIPKGNMLVVKGVLTQFKAASSGLSSSPSVGFPTFSLLSHQEIHISFGNGHASTNCFKKVKAMCACAVYLCSPNLAMCRKSRYEDKPAPQ
jgi:hypothetical protein